MSSGARPQEELGEVPPDVTPDPSPPRKVLVLRGSPICDEDAALLAKETGRLVIILPDGATLDSLDEEDMRAEGWIRA